MDSIATFAITIIVCAFKVLRVTLDQNHDLTWFWVGRFFIEKAILARIVSTTYHNLAMW
jgi:hypothetical protein